MQALLWIALGVIAAYTVFILAPAIVFYRVIFTRRKDMSMTEPTFRDEGYAPYEEPMKAAYAFVRQQPCRPLSMKAGDGAELHGVFYDAGSANTAVLLHGYNASPAPIFGLQAKYLYQSGFNVAFLYQRGHGESGGVSTLGCKESQDLLDWIPRLLAETDTKQILLYGLSMGCATVALASDRLDPGVVKGMVLDCGFTSAYDQLAWEMKKRHMPVFLIGPLLSGWARRFLGIDIKRSTTGSLSETTVPALFFHGEQDKTVPIAQGRANFEACASDKTWLSSDAAGHVLCYPSRQDACERQLAEFIERYFS